ncbi:hypothetical protein G7046_g8244 [Stylonectria norvegica]|nr:hypothetical protein G7046_g8244 [Stylonectria norvegica]
MTLAYGSVTPPPPSGIRTPPTPRLGYHDHWEPFTPRKSARLSSQRASNRTPSPNSSHRKQPQSRRTAKKPSQESSSSIASPMPSPQKKRLPALDSVRRAAGVSTSSEGVQGAEGKAAQRPPPTTVSRASGMLPTPSKTPQKAPNEKTAANIKNFARNLFPSDEEAMPSPRKKRAKKYTGISMESFTAEDVEESIEIFTDSQDRIPVKDDSESNPFYGSIATPEPTQRRSKRKQVNVPGVGSQSIDAASRREDGMVYVFRGKKFFRKFTDNSEDDMDELQGDDVDSEALLSRPLTRKSIKPRLLFQPAKTNAMIEEEEALTDVEDMPMEPVEEIPQTPVKTRKHRANTPDAPKFAPVSPPDTKRTTRSSNMLKDDETPIPPRSGANSPFDKWLRTKDRKTQATRSTSATKRQGDSLASAAKRTRT